MHKKIESELVSLAHSILQMKNREDALALKDKAQAIYEKLSVITFVDEYVATTPNLNTSKEQLLKNINIKLESKQPVVKISEPEIIKTKPELIEEIVDEEIFEPKFDDVKIDIQSLKSNQISSKEEFRDAISADKTATLFDDDNISEKKTLNDKMFGQTIKVGLNDRIAFVQHLFNFSQEEFNRVLSQLNTLKTEKEAKDFIYNTVKPDYNWAGKENYEERLIALIERKFS